MTNDILRQKYAQDDAGRWVSRLWPREALDPINRHDSATGRIHREMTLPWLDNSKRILPSASFDKYMAIMRTRRPERAELVKDFTDHLDLWIHKAELMREGLFNRAEYPSHSDAVARFSFSVSAEPVPHRDDFRIALSAPDMAEMQSTLDERLTAAENAVRNELLQRITGPLVKIVERLSEPDAKFQDSLISNVRAMADTIPDLNVTDDPAIEAIRVRILSGLGKLHPETLRSSRSDRSRAASEANNILATFAPWMPPLVA